MPRSRRQGIDFGQREVVPQLVADLERRIRSGERGLEPGQPLPAASELRRYYGGGSADTYTKVRQELHRLGMIAASRVGVSPQITSPEKWGRPVDVRVGELEERMGRVEDVLGLAAVPDEDAEPMSAAQMAALLEGRLRGARAHLDQLQEAVDSFQVAAAATPSDKHQEEPADGQRPDPDRLATDLPQNARLAAERQ